MNQPAPTMTTVPVQGGIEAYVPLRQLPNGRAMLRAPSQAELTGPPNVAGMPQMPAFPPGMFGGGIPSAGTGQPTTPVAPFNPVPLGVQMADRARFQVYPGPASLGGLVLPIPLGPRAVYDESGRPF